MPSGGVFAVGWYQGAGPPPKRRWRGPCTVYVAAAISYSLFLLSGSGRRVFCSAVLQRGIRVHPNKRANITRSVYIFPMLAIYDFLEKRQRKRDVRRVSFRSLLAVRKTAPHFRFCLSVFRLERHAVGKLCRFLSSSETVLCAMLE